MPRRPPPTAIETARPRPPHAPTGMLIRKGDQSKQFNLVPGYVEHRSLRLYAYPGTHIILSEIAD